jgi:F-type H+-transporting ATPase subunit epsilon
MSGLHLEIVTPTRTAFANVVTEVTLPGSIGELGILPGHLPLITTLQPGEIAAHTSSGVRSFAVGSGYAQVLPDRVRVLVDDCSGVDEIDIVHAKAELADLEARLDKDEFLSSDELDEATEHAARARARIALVERATR